MWMIYLIQSIPENVSQGIKCLNLKEDKQVEKVLGVFWEQHGDKITFKIAAWLMQSDIFRAQERQPKEKCSD